MLSSSRKPRKNKIKPIRSNSIFQVWTFGRRINYSKFSTLVLKFISEQEVQMESYTEMAIVSTIKRRLNNYLK